MALEHARASTFSPGRAAPLSAENEGAFPWEARKPGWYRVKAFTPLHPRSDAGAYFYASHPKKERKAL